jgi:hypothetical protein
VQRVEEACRPPGAAHAVEAWVRLEAIVRGRAFGVLPASVAAWAAPQFIDHTFTTDDCDIPAVRGSAAPPLQRGDECRRPQRG